MGVVYSSARCRFISRSSSINNILQQNDERNQTNKTELDVDLTYLIGKLERLPAYAKKLFELSKLYLTSAAENSNDCKSQSFHMTESAMIGRSEQCQASNELSSLYLFTPLKQKHPLHCGQTFIQWKATFDVQQLAYMCAPSRNTIYLQPLDSFPEVISQFVLPISQLYLSLFQLLQGFCQIFFLGVEVVLLAPVSSTNWNIRSRLSHSTGRPQLCVNDFFPLLRLRVPNNGIGLVGILWTDLYPEGFNFVLGEASVYHKSAVVSFGVDTSEDMTQVSGVLVWRLFKTLTHEICHLLGLTHCEFFSCAMNESISISQAMSQPLVLCPVCLRKVQHVCGFDVLERYTKLHHFLLNVTKQLDGDLSQFNQTIQWLHNCILYVTH
nr:archaemetzincin-2-like; partial [Biomphalaria glabrata]